MSTVNSGPVENMAGVQVCSHATTRDDVTRSPALSALLKRIGLDDEAVKLLNARMSPD